MVWFRLFLIGGLLLIGDAMANPRLTVLGAGGTSTLAAYVGPGDVVSTFQVWYGLRGYTASYSSGSNNGIKVRRASDDTTSDIKILSTGALDSASAATFAGTDATATCTIAGTAMACTGASGTIHVNDPVSGVGITDPCIVTATNGSTTATVSLAGTSTTCGTVSVGVTTTFQVALFIHEWYDQTGNTKHQIQTTTTSQALLLLTCQNGKPCASAFTNGNAAYYTLNSAISAVATPSFSLVAARTTGAQQETIISAKNDGSAMIYGKSATNTWFYFGTTGGDFTVSDNTMHAVQVVGGASPVANVDGSDGAITPGAVTTGTVFAIFTQGGSTDGFCFACLLSEVGFKASGFSSGDRSALQVNQKAYWGTP